MIVPAAESDAERIARLHIASWQATYVRELSQEFLQHQDIAARTEEWRDRLARGDIVLLATEADEVVGFVACGPREGGSGKTDEWEIYNLHVASSRHGHGHGSQLFDAAVEIGREAGARDLMLWVVRTNHAARTFYERKGMVLDGGTQEHQVTPQERLSEVRYRGAL